MSAGCRLVWLQLPEFSNLNNKYHHIGILSSLYYASILQQGDCSWFGSTQTEKGGLILPVIHSHGQELHAIYQLTQFLWCIWLADLDPQTFENKRAEFLKTGVTARDYHIIGTSWF